MYIQIVSSHKSTTVAPQSHGVHFYQVYVDITMKAAKENDAQTAEQYSRESVRVARTTREWRGSDCGFWGDFEVNLP